MKETEFLKGRLKEFRTRANSLVCQERLSEPMEREVEMVQAGYMRVLPDAEWNKKLSFEALQAKARRFAIMDILLTIMQREHFDRIRTSLCRN